ncbi:MAG: GNAT family N-acetyltransferase [Oscillospiraceae bacterium]
MTIKKLDPSEYAPALELVWRVFLEFEAPDYTQEGIDEFRRSINDSGYLSMLTVYGGYVDGVLAGVIATRNFGGHVALFFVDRQYQRKGIGRKLFSAVLADCKFDSITVNSSPYAVEVYHHLGFTDTDNEQTVSGLRFTPMRFDRSKSGKN